MEEEKSSTPKSNDGGHSGVTLQAVAGILKELGLPSFIIVIVTFIFLLFASPAQKSEFIDKYVLLKNISGDPLPFTIVVISLILIIAIGGYYQLKMINFLKKENQRIGSEKSKLQEQLLNHQLTSSDDPLKTLEK